MNTSVMDASLYFYRQHKYSLIVIAAGMMLLVIVSFPLLEMIGRPIFGQGISGSIKLVSTGLLGRSVIFRLHLYLRQH